MIRLQPKKSSKPCSNPSSVPYQANESKGSALAGNCDLREAQNLVSESFVFFVFVLEV
jgi:hypothetical protein